MEAGLMKNNSVRGIGIDADNVFANEIEVGLV